MHETKDRNYFREMVREYPEYKDGRITEDQAEGIAERLYTNLQEIIEQAVKVELRRTLIKMVAQGEAVYDPETDRYAPRHVVDAEVSRGEATYDPETGVYRGTR